MSNKIQKILKRSSDPDLIIKAFKFAKTAYKDRNRTSGENYIEHAIRVALALSEMNLDSKTIAAGLLHDVVDEMPISLKKIELRDMKKNFGEEVAFLAEKVSELSKLRYPLTIKSKGSVRFARKKIENLRKMFFAQAKDLRVVLIELVSRIDNLNTLNCLPPEQQKLYALETLKIFVPMANRLGMREIKSKLEDLSFFYLYPEKFQELRVNVKEKYEERKKYLRSLTPHIKKILKSEGINVLDINSRAKSYWSTYQKLFKNNMDFEKIYDLVALRIIVDNIKNCYKTLGIIHKYWRPLYREIDDFIAKPRPNGYRSLHTTVFCDKGEITEIQIRTNDMHKEAEYGICAHWAYKEKIDLKKEKKKFDWVKKIPKFWKTSKIDFFTNQVFVFTPKGDVIALPKESTVIDFAYAVHSEIGDHCESVKVNGKIASLSQYLKNADVVEIIINKKRVPSPDWLKFVKTNLARAHIKKALALAETKSPFKISFFGKKKISSPKLIKKKVPKISRKIKKEKVKEIYLAGEKGILVNLAKCCSPKSSDEIKAYITKYRGAVLHKTSCKNFQRLSKKFPYKVLDASWR